MDIRLLVLIKSWKKPSIRKGLLPIKEGRVSVNKKIPRDPCIYTLPWLLLNFENRRTTSRWNYKLRIFFFFEQFENLMVWVLKSRLFWRVSESFFRKFQFVLVYTFTVFWSNKKRPYVARYITSHVRVLQHFLCNRCRLVRRSLACWDRPLNVCDLTPRFPRRRKCLLLCWSLYGWCGLITRMSFYLWQMGRNTSILLRENDSFCSKNYL